MSTDSKESSRCVNAAQSTERRDSRDVPLDELKRQLGLNLIEAARDRFGSEAYAPLMRYRR